MDLTGDFGGSRPRTALALLFQKQLSSVPTVLNPTRGTGLDAMVVPEDCEDLLREIRDGAEVCEALFMLTTADNAFEVDNETKAIAKSLDAYWEAHSQIVNRPKGLRPVASGLSDRAPLDMASLSEAVPGLLIRSVWTILRL